MITSIRLGENVTEDFQVINEQNIFSPINQSICALIKMEQIKKSTNLICTWSIVDSTSNSIIGVYELPISGNEEPERYAVVGIDLNMLFNEKIIEKESKMCLSIELDNEIKNKFFLLKLFNTYTNDSKISSKVENSIHSIEWKI